ncbi:hypothetical protein EG68_01049 [Paragonimus skrjabini miyazakii]|uniref:Uncharacterized protein n=1 Tax=Paragonimus skrjabini miyazakii TaxID=59628 RepID=A0A8S9Z7M3_9TREM|nr:hypothetical protein EG68_01049 [Paragonimus skrjabini miyazakii]
MLKLKAKPVTIKSKTKSLPKKIVKLGAAQVAAFVSDQVKSDVFDDSNMVTDCSLHTYAQIPSINTSTTKEDLSKQHRENVVKESAAEMASKVISEDDQSLWDDAELVNDNSNTFEVMDQEALLEETPEERSLIHETQTVLTGTASEIAGRITNTISIPAFQTCTLVSDYHGLNTSELRRNKEVEKSISLLPDIDDSRENSESRRQTNTDMKNLLAKFKGKAAEICGHLALSNPATNTIHDTLITDLSLIDSPLSLSPRQSSGEKLNVASTNQFTGPAAYIANIIANSSYKFGLKDTCLIPGIYHSTKDTTTIKRSSTPGTLMVDCAATNVQQPIGMPGNFAYSLADTLARLYGTKEVVDCNLIDDKLLKTESKKSSNESDQTLKVLPKLKSKAPQLASTLIQNGKANVEDDADIFSQLTESRPSQKRISLLNEDKTAPKTRSACLLANHFTVLNPHATIDNYKLVTDYSLINSAVQHYVIYARQNSNSGLAITTKSELFGTAPEIARKLIRNKGYELNGDTSLVTCFAKNDPSLKNMFVDKNDNKRKPESINIFQNIPAPVLAAKLLKEIQILDNHTLVGDKQLAGSDSNLFNHNDDTHPIQHNAEQGSSDEHKSKLKGSAPHIAKLLLDKGLVVTDGDTSLTEKTNQTTAYYKLDRKFTLNIALAQPEDECTNRSRTTFVNTLIPKNTTSNNPAVSRNKVYPTEKLITIVRIGGRPKGATSTFPDTPSVQSSTHQNMKAPRSTTKAKKTEDRLSTELSRKSTLYDMQNIGKVRTRYTPTYMHINEDMYRSGYRLRSLGSASRVNIFDGRPTASDYTRRQLARQFSTFSHSQENVRDSNLRIYTYERAFSMNASLREARTQRQARAFSLTGDRTSRSLMYLKSAEDHSATSSMSLAKETISELP